MSESPSWSPSRSSRWRACPRQFLLRDVLDAPPTQHTAKHLLRGRVMHAGLEAAIRVVASGRRRDARTMAAFTDEAYDAMRDSPAATDLSTADLADCLRIVGAALTTLQVPLAGAIIGVEHPFSLRHGQILIEGVMDLVLRTGPDSLRIIDWKSGDIPRRAEEIEGHTALNVYSVAASRCWPWAKTIEVGLHSISRNRSVNLIATPDMQEMALARLVQDHHAARYARERLTAKNVNSLFPARSGDHCQSCEHRSYCPLFADSAPPVRAGVDVDTERQRVATKIFLAH